MNIILLGAPGGGKGTQSEFLCEKNGFVQLSTGDLFRSNIMNKTSLGTEAQKYMDQGLYVPDTITNGMVQEFLKTKSDGLIFDGYPRTAEQASALDEMLEALQGSIDKVIYFEIDAAILMDRLTGRLICQTCKRSYHIKNRPPLVEGVCDYDHSRLIVRPDDAPDKVRTRLMVYQEQTAPLVDFYKDKLIKIDANNKTPVELYQDLVKVLAI
ncbi:adenylate kinase [Spiroplasma clarkii]|uniref:Adenylate kinase n=1 Tax=Spiroplasma clarkii TaxID=2139 RepID=A0A1Y0L060_9MOLU|nr:adenylate kinase [Spiroplasma clarkii]ARU91099.1 adenylate kinase [Spiroplasma clarkii]ATX70540.1 adenylate kinase [Spiroplasma clarkii]